MIAPTQEFLLSPMSYEHFQDSVGPNDVVTVGVTSTDAVSVFFVDEENFAAFSKGEGYQFFGKHQVLRMNRAFTPPYPARWYLVIHNPTNQTVTVSVVAVMQRVGRYA